MGREQAEQPRAVGQLREQRQIVTGQPAIKRARADALERKELAQRDEFARIQLGAGMVGYGVHALIHAAK